MNWLIIVFNLVLLLIIIEDETNAYIVKSPTDLKSEDTSGSGENHLSKSPKVNHLISDLTSNDDAQETANFYSSDIGEPYNSASDYGSLFDSFPNLPYFPEFEEIFRIPRTTTQEPPFKFPEYVRDVFPERPPESPLKPIDRGPSGRFGDAIGGGRRPARRPPRPASSGTRTKVTKHNQNEPKEKVKPSKLKSPNKSKDYPKIFRFTSDRVNLAEFDMKKKMNENYLTLAKGDELDSTKVRRNKFLILHGGIFEIEKSAFGKRHLYQASNNDSKNHETDSEIYKYKSIPQDDKTELDTLPFFYRT